MDGLIERAFQKLQEEEERKHVNFHQLEDKEQAYLKASEQCTLQSEQWTPGSFETDHVGKHISVPSNCLGRSSPCPRDGFWRDWKWPKTVLHMKALQHKPECLSTFKYWAQMWTLEMANKAETTRAEGEYCSADQKLTICTARRSQSHDRSHSWRLA